MKVKELFETEERSILSVMGKQEDPYSGHFHGCNNKLTSLEGAPNVINGGFDCDDNMLASLKGAPHTIHGSFFCSGNRLTSLEGAPRIVTGDFYFNGNRLISLKGIHKQIKHIGKTIVFKANPIKSHVLGLLKIDGLREVFFDDVALAWLMTKHLKGDRDIFACQEELIEAGYPEFAQL